MRYSKEQINERFQILPSSVQDIILSAEVADTIKAIADKNNLHIDTAGLLNEEITFVMVGAEKSVNFIKNLRIYLHLSEDKVNAVAGEVNEKIFLPIREALKNVANKPEQALEPEITEIIDDSNLHKKEIELENKIEHAPLTESEEIRKQIEEQRLQAVKPPVAPPPNLPTQSDAPTDELNLGARRPSEEKKPFHVDPYREPIE
jgi:hypothetical protein